MKLSLHRIAAAATDVSSGIAAIRSLALLIIALSAALLVSVGRADAQIAGLSQTDIGDTGASGSYSFDSGTYTVSGAGSGIGGSADSFSFVSTSATGNIELVCRVGSQTNTSSYAMAGLMVRESTEANAPSAAIVVTPAGGVTFVARNSSQQGGAWSECSCADLAAHCRKRLFRGRISGE